VDMITSLFKGSKYNKHYTTEPTNAQHNGTKLNATLMVVFSSKHDKLACSSLVKRLANFRRHDIHQNVVKHYNTQQLPTDSIMTLIMIKLNDTHQNDTLHYDSQHTTHSITTPSTMTYIIPTLNIKITKHNVTQHNVILHNDTQHSNDEHNDSQLITHGIVSHFNLFCSVYTRHVIMLSVILLSVVAPM